MECELVSDTKPYQDESKWTLKDLQRISCSQKLRGPSDEGARGPSAGEIMRKSKPLQSNQVDFFVSYTKTNLAWAKWITWQLENEGYQCLVQFRDFRPGTDFMDGMRAALTKTRQVIAVLSTDYLESKYAQSELNAALRRDPLGRGSVLLPIRVENCEPQEILQGRIYIDLVGKPPAQAKRDLLQGIAASRLSAKRSASARFPSRPPFPVEDPNARRIKRGMDAQITLASEDRHSKVDVLFLASEANTGLNLRGQFRDLRAAVRGTLYGPRFRFHPVFDATPEHLFDALNSCNPSIVHISGKQDGGNILMNSDSGGVRTIPDAALAGLLRALDGVKIAIIDTCTSLRCATTIAEAVEAAMGVQSFIYEDDATTFYCALYRAFASGKSLRDSAAQASATLQFKRVPKAQIPQIRTKPGVDAKNIFLFRRSDH
jgi:hypothetical protein